MKQKQLGFTLIEVVMSIAIFSMVSVVIGRLVYAGFQTFNASNNISEVDWNMNLAQNRFSTEVHTIRSASDISSASASQFSFTDNTGGSVTYSFSGAALLRNGTPIATGMVGGNFSYLTSTGAATTTPSAIRYVVLTLDLQSDVLSTQASILAGTRGFA